MSFYERGAADGGFENGIRLSLQAMLASPHFIFRVERQPAGTRGGEAFALSDFDLASRLSFFLWGSPPDEELLAVASDGRLSQPDVFDQQAPRMLADLRSEALATRFAAQWLRLQDMYKVRPDAFWFPNFDENTMDGMRRRDGAVLSQSRPRGSKCTGAFHGRLHVPKRTSSASLWDTGRGGESVSAGTVFGCPPPWAVGAWQRAAVYPQWGAGRPPVLRGKWVMEVLLGSPPPRAASRCPRSGGDTGGDEWQAPDNS